ncbi:MAG TPA: alanine--glyoxylate aminotransferase family protein [Acidobacteriota bacterium]|nr:alanine--glyoxylate aminotransferase family protein [Acidobacteriota bacterium]
MKPDGRYSERLLMGPGPSNVSARVREAIARPLLGHLDPDFLSLMSEIQELLRQVFLTSNRLTLPVSGTGSAGMEAALVNFLEPDDSVLVGVHGVFGQRMAEVARRCRARVEVVEAPFGQPLDLDELRSAARKSNPRVVAVVHAETSTGVLTPLEPVRRICDETGSLLLVDAVTSLAGLPLRIDDWGLDIAYSGTQKCLSCPPGLAPLTVSQRAAERLANRKSRVQSWYLDLSMVQNYWGSERTYHHTAPISMNYALLAALQEAVEEGLEERWRRHERNHLALVAGIEAMGLRMYVQPKFRLWSLNTVTIPEGVDDERVRARLLRDFNLEIGGGLGSLKGRVWRVGLMGESSRMRNVLYFLHGLERALAAEGFHCPPGGGVQAAATS